VGEQHSHLTAGALPTKYVAMYTPNAPMRLPEMDTLQRSPVATPAAFAAEHRNCVNPSIPGVIACCRLFEGMQLGDRTRLSGLTGLTLRGVGDSHHGTLVAVLPRMTALRSLVLADDSTAGLPATGGCCCCPGRNCQSSWSSVPSEGF
jgi:hypothetical protein